MATNPFDFTSDDNSSADRQKPSRSKPEPVRSVSANKEIPPPKPTLVTILTIGNFIVAGLGVMYLFGCFILPWIFNTLTSDPKEKKMGSIFKTEDIWPFYLHFFVNCLVISGMLGICGLGLKRARSWGRWVCLATGPAAGLNFVAFVTYATAMGFPFEMVFFMVSISGLPFLLYPPILTVCMFNQSVKGYFDLRKKSRVIKSRG